MKLTPFLLAALAPALAIGCTGAPFLGHFAVFLVTMGIFVGTLSMNRKAVDKTGETSENVSTHVDPDKGA